MRRDLLVLAVLFSALAIPVATCAENLTAAAPGTPRFEVEFDTQVGAPSGYVEVREFSLEGSRLDLRRDLRINTSEAVAFTARYHLTEHDAVRATFLYYFLDGTARFDRAKPWDGEEIGPGRVDTNLDFWRGTVAYERVLFKIADGVVTGSIGATYVHLNARIQQKAEDFYLQELPVPVAGLRLDYPITERLSARVGVEGGGLPRVDSLRNEGGTVYLTQYHADGEAAVTYSFSGGAFVGGGYQFSYFYQGEHSAEDGNRLKLIDNAFRLRAGWRF